MDGWNTTFLLGRPIFSGYVSFREGNWFVKVYQHTHQVIRSSWPKERSRHQLLGHVVTSPSQKGHKLAELPGVCSRQIDSLKMLGIRNTIVKMNMNTLPSYMLVNIPNYKHPQKRSRCSRRICQAMLPSIPPLRFFLGPTWGDFFLVISPIDGTQRAWRFFWDRNNK